MWSAVSDFLIKAHASGLGHDAVIEIMIALLGVMVAILGVMLGVVGLFFAGLSIYGYQTIKQESKRVAAKIAQDTATAAVIREVGRLATIDNTTALSAAEDHNEAPQSTQHKGRKTSDASLNKRKRR